MNYYFSFLNLKSSYESLKGQLFLNLNFVNQYNQ